MDIETLQNHLKGLEAKGKELREQEALLLKSQGLQEQEEKARADAVRIESEIEALKTEIDEAKSKRAELMDSITSAIGESISEALPEGKALVRFDESGFFLGWSIYGNEKPYRALSDGEKATFNPALCKALGANLLIIEAAEADDKRLGKILEQMGKFSGQVIVCTWFKPAEIPAGWNVVEL